MAAPEFVQAATLVFSLAAKAGMIHQVWKSWKRKNCDGLSVPFFAIGFGAYAVRVINGLTGGGWGLVWGEIPGVILCLAILCQVRAYRRNKWSTE